MDPCLYTFIDKLEAEHTLYASEWQQLLDGYTPRLAAYLFEKSRRARIQFYGHDVYIRGLIEFTNYCRNNCYYCGIRSGNTHVHRYRLTKEEILSCCETGYELGFRTFVLQGGEDPYYTTARLSDVVHTIRTTYPDCAITLSTGEATKEEYQQLFDAGANRLLLRQHRALSEAASGTAFCCPQTAMPLGFKRNRISGWNRIYGRISLADERTSGRRSVVSQRAESSDGRDRPIYSTP